MSATKCPVCTSAKDQAWHLVCRTCWSTVPQPQQDRLFTLYRRERGSATHRELCLTILRALYKAQRDASSERAVIKTTAAQPPPITADQVPDEWVNIVRHSARRDGHTIRAGAGATIEVQSIDHPEQWPVLMLPNSGTLFASAADRDAVLEKIQRGGSAP